MKFAYARRLRMGDSKFIPDMAQLVANLSSPEYGEATRRLINDSYTHPTSFYLDGLTSSMKEQGTSHISVVDGNGNAVAVTSTINIYFGSAVMGEKTGIIYNDEMDDFSSPNETNYFNLPPSPENFIKPGKRPMSSMSPVNVLVSDEKNVGKKRIAQSLGAAGGSRITSAVAYISARMLWFDETPKQAIDALRIHHQLLPEKLLYEVGMPQIILDELMRTGHTNQTVYLASKGVFSVAGAIQKVKNGTIFANADFRKPAATDGF